MRFPIQIVVLSGATVSLETNLSFLTGRTCYKFTCGQHNGKFLWVGQRAKPSGWQKSGSRWPCSTYLTVRMQEKYFFIFFHLLRKTDSGLLFLLFNISFYFNLFSILTDRLRITSLIKGLRTWTQVNFQRIIEGDSRPYCELFTRILPR